MVAIDHSVVLMNVYVRATSSLIKELLCDCPVGFDFRYPTICRDYPSEFVDWVLWNETQWRDGHLTQKERLRCVADQIFFVKVTTYFVGDDQKRFVP